VLSTNLAVFPTTGNDIIEINEPSAPFGAPTITLDAYDGDDLIKVRRLDRGLILNCGVGNDTVDVARAGAASAILGSLTINGDVGKRHRQPCPGGGERHLRDHRIRHLQRRWGR
jgi:hypothetical protein